MGNHRPLRVARHTGACVAAIGWLLASGRQGSAQPPVEPAAPLEPASSPNELDPTAAPAPSPEDAARAQPSELEDIVLARQIENPVSGILRIPVSNTVLFGLGPDDDVGNVLALAPILPALFRNEWSLITRVILPLAVTVPDLAAGSGNITGFGDMAADVLAHKAIEGR
ncbi:MAG: hypothetical protein AAGF92_12270 [Myxococcota bacterium]